jgi:hypothetical protein
LKGEGNRRESDVDSNIHASLNPLALSHDPCSTNRAELQLISSPSRCKLGVERKYFVFHLLGSKFIVLQCSFTLLNGEAAGAWEHPLVALPGTDAAVAVHERGYFWDLDVEFESSAVAIAVVGL